MKEKVRTIYKSKRVTIKEIISPKNFNHSFSQNVDEYVYVLKGSANLQIGKKKLALKKGESLFLKKGTRNNKFKTSDKEETIWLATYFR